MVPTFTLLSERDIAARKAELLARAGMPRHELIAKGLAYQLTPAEDAIKRELEDLDYLDGDGHE
ncbi:hypothetical protein [Paramicrobacterium agarici]|uniref:hypothetical protein n=1 Tax=Paramicrobacterium agarici TaxID=630514 RepID=UPI001150B088|nr:hypothetical protein [Microbacterium agarici]TQO22907.1 hypothetical protein FB385_1749 [Microbacterium agarici]